MNCLKASVTEIKSVDNLTVIAFEAFGQPMRMMALGLGMPLEIGQEVVLGVKATNIALAKELKGVLSTSNVLECKIESIDDGELLSSVKLSLGDRIFESIITRDSSSRMDLKKGDEVQALIKASEVSILEVLS